MSSLVNKVKEVLHSDNKSSQPEGTHGPHSSRVANAADPRIDSDRDHRENLASHDGSYTSSDNYSYGDAGTHSQSANRTDGPATKTDGPHKSNLANKADPRVDSDRDHSKNMGMNPSGTATTGTGTTGFNSQDRTHGVGTHGVGTTGFSSGTTGIHKSGAPEGTYGPHGSRLANAADPLVDSDRDRSHNLPGGTTGVGGTTGFSGSNTGTGNTGGAFFNSGSTGGVPEGTFGPHSSRMANAADPRVDSDRDNSRNMGLHSNTGTYGSSGAPEGTYGPHGSRIANAADPRVDSDRDNSRNIGLHSGTGTHGTTGFSGSTTGVAGLGSSYAATGPAPNTAGPHKSDILNKADPRVDSDLDGSKTFGGDRTFNQSEGRTKAKDPTDAAQVPPSVLRKHIGNPTIEHNDAKHDRERRHSISHQEQHRGL